MADKGPGKTGNPSGGAGNVTGKRGRGRPATAPEYSLAHPLSLRLPGAAYALLEAEADARGESLSATARDIIIDFLTSREGQD